MPIGFVVAFGPGAGASAADATPPTSEEAVRTEVARTNCRREIGSGWGSGFMREGPSRVNGEDYGLVLFPIERELSSVLIWAIIYVAQHKPDSLRCVVRRVGIYQLFVW